MFIITNSILDSVLLSCYFESAKQLNERTEYSHYYQQIVTILEYKQKHNKDNNKRKPNRQHRI